jgi:hypothetical protein
MKTTIKLSVNGTLLALASIILLAGACKKDINSSGKDLIPAGSEGNLKTNAVGTNGPKGVCYVEVNNNDLRNVARYTLTNGSPLFDVGIIFAANINFNTTSRTAELFFNPQVTNVLSNRDIYVKPLQDKGIKVLLSILGNHQGAGISNFTSRASAQAFAQQLSNAVNTYKLDGIDLDDEFSEYGKNGTTQPNDSSFVFLVTALRQLMPTKIISFYFFGPASGKLSYNGVTVGSKITYTWNASYGSYNPPAVSGLAKSNIGPAAIDITNTGAGLAASLATRTVSDGYGIYLYYNLPNADSHTYLSSVSNALYGLNTVFN